MKCVHLFALVFLPSVDILQQELWEHLFIPTCLSWADQIVQTRLASLGKLIHSG